MEKEYVIQIAQTIQEQLIGLTPMPVLMSWGIAEFAATIFKGLPTSYQSKRTVTHRIRHYCT